MATKTAKKIEQPTVTPINKDDRYGELLDMIIELRNEVGRIGINAGVRPCKYKIPTEDL